MLACRWRLLILCLFTRASLMRVCVLSYPYSAASSCHLPPGDGPGLDRLDLGNDKGLGSARSNSALLLDPDPTRPHLCVFSATLFCVNPARTGRLPSFFESL